MNYNFVLYCYHKATGDDDCWIAFEFSRIYVYIISGFTFVFKTTLEGKQFAGMFLLLLYFSSSFVYFILEMFSVFYNGFFKNIIPLAWYLIIHDRTSLEIERVRIETSQVRDRQYRPPSLTIILLLNNIFCTFYIEFHALLFSRDNIGYFN